MIDTKYYYMFKKLKEKWPHKMVFISEHDIANAPKDKSPTGFRDYIARRFLQEHKLVITRFTHDYKRDELGLVYLAGDSVINPGFEVWALVGYNAEGAKNILG